MGAGGPEEEKGRVGCGSRERKRESDTLGIGGWEREGGRFPLVQYSLLPLLTHSIFIVILLSKKTEQEKLCSDADYEIEE